MPQPSTQIRSSILLHLAEPSKGQIFYIQLSYTWQRLPKVRYFIFSSLTPGRDFQRLDILYLALLHLAQPSIQIRYSVHLHLAEPSIQVTYLALLHLAQPSIYSRLDLQYSYTWPQPSRAQIFSSLTPGTAFHIDQIFSSLTPGMAQPSIQIRSSVLLHLAWHSLPYRLDLQLAYTWHGTAATAFHIDQIFSSLTPGRAFQRLDILYLSLLHLAETSKGQIFYIYLSYTWQRLPKVRYFIFISLTPGTALHILCSKLVIQYCYT